MLSELLRSMMDRTCSVINANSIHIGDSVRKIEGWVDGCDLPEPFPIPSQTLYLVIDRRVRKGSVGIIPDITHDDRVSSEQRIKGTSLKHDLAQLEVNECIRYVDASLIVGVRHSDHSPVG